MNSNFQFKFRNSRFYLTSLIVQLPSFLHTEKSLFSPVLPSCPVGNDLNIFLMFFYSKNRVYAHLSISPFFLHNWQHTFFHLFLLTNKLWRSLNTSIYRERFLISAQYSIVQMQHNIFNQSLLMKKSFDLRKKWKFYLSQILKK